jgi:hypothetical protein
MPVSILQRASHLLMMKRELSSDSMVDEGTNVIDDEEDIHRCSMVKRYFMPTFFGANKSKYKVP